MAGTFVEQVTFKIWPLIVHEIVQQKDGTLAVKPLDTVERAFTNHKRQNFWPILADWDIKNAEHLFFL
ncbi:hypothetical protein ACFFHM_18795 [Halalkalibacter kiskunsagensis]|uniref:Uncharacterized protein n=1 Tax=Halalkalibacter kiskunsagensis TaxID=1548599 RepID=A0ABV6KGP6_9BACI